MNKLIIFSAPSGSGKSTIVRHLLSLEKLNLAFSISATSRAPRGEEQHGREYYFLSVDEFKKRIASGDFLEWEEVYAGNFYGTLRTEVERLWSLGKTVVFDIDVVGGLRIKEQFPEQSLAIFVKPPSIEELEKRLRNRQTESEDKIKMRLDKASQELAQAEKFDIIIENDNLQKALQESENVVVEFLKSK
ncbi:guanylate kinase [Capnocytophaga stomatis]|uniref:guanylate kinase n=1 Tax=Capnocytophaga stomatis TaxID=1848904 RepID=UPI0019503103|nr:guanylate kinase [Capnocytophaga stomatis]GIJ93235.1 guanylate kinase [Capnocytophaga stomatis]GIM50328.1 guanylate kinase [Capnocytophaga stomatis]